MPAYHRRRASAARNAVRSGWAPSYTDGDAHPVNTARVEKSVGLSVEERLIEWRKLEQAASDAEHAVQALGQAAADPRVPELLSNAKSLRQKADREFATILRAIKLDEPTSERRSSDSNGGSAHPH